jgi:hypothetical protein
MRVVAASWLASNLDEIPPLNESDPPQADETRPMAISCVDPCAGVVKSGYGLRRGRFNFRRTITAAYYRARLLPGRTALPH